VPSSPSSSLLLELQATGENITTWGPKLNTLFKALEAALQGVTTHTLTGNIALAYTNYTLTSGTDFAQIIASASTGGPHTITLGAYERAHLFINLDATAHVIACSGGGESVTIAAGQAELVYCDGTNVRSGNWLSRLGGMITGAVAFGSTVTLATDPSLALHAVTKQYADALAFAALQGDLPAQTGNAGKFLGTDGAVADWDWTLPAQSGATLGQALTSPGANGKGAWAWPKLVPWTEISTNTNAADNARYAVDTSGGAVTLTLPASPDGEDEIWIKDLEFSFGDNPLTIDANGKGIAGTDGTLVIDTPMPPGSFGVLRFSAAAGKWC
jgi:hypothetical protein